jgi:hypothetical protein
MKPYYRVFRPNGVEGSSHKIETREEASLFAEGQCKPGEALEIAMIIGLTSRPKASTFWCDGCVDTSEPGG